MCAAEDGRSVAVGDTTGRVCAIDCGTAKSLVIFKGFSGSVRRLEYHPEHPLLVSVGIDRYLRVHDTQKGKLLHRVYLKQRLAEHGAL